MSLMRNITIKDGSSSSQAVVKDDGVNNALVVTQNSQPLPTNAATSAKQDDILTELAQKTEPGNNQLVDILPVLRTISLLLANPGYVDKTANQLRAQVTGTITTVTTVTGLTNIDSQQGRQLIINQNVNAWANVCRARIS